MEPRDLESLRRALKDAEARRLAVRAELQILQGQLQGLEDECRGLQLALDRHGAGSPPANPFLQMNRTEAVEEILRRAAGSPLSPQVITEVLRRAGRDDEYESVGATLAHLLRTNRAHAPSRGNWVYGPAGGRPPHGLDDLGDPDSEDLADFEDEDADEDDGW